MRFGCGDRREHSSTAEISSTRRIDRREARWNRRVIEVPRSLRRRLSSLNLSSFGSRGSERSSFRRVAEICSAETEFSQPRFCSLLRERAWNRSFRRRTGSLETIGNRSDFCFVGPLSLYPEITRSGNFGSNRGPIVLALSDSCQTLGRIRGRSGGLGGGGWDRRSALSDGTRSDSVCRDDGPVCESGGRFSGCGV